MGYIRLMIKSFRNKGLERFATKGDASRLSVQQADRVRRLLAAIDAATRPGQLDIPGFHYHPLKPTPRHSVRVTGNWRITFGWDGDDAIDVDLEDYH